ncbi:MAG: hypothetical protein GC193_14975 [Cryomorphaceae bacterium]|nr:hypothetical protein [Cryomorphaceae bacterium]
MKRVVLNVVFMLCCLSAVHGQKKKEFSKIPDEFVKELANLLGDSKKEGKKWAEEEFGPIFMSGAITPLMKSKTVEACNKFQDAKLSAYPVFYEYLRAVMYYPRSRKPEEFFMTWHDFMYKMLDDKKLKKQLPGFIETSASLYERQAFYATGAVEWKFSNASYDFVFDSIPSIVFPGGNLIGLSKGDSTVIYDTKGIYYPLTNKWDGDGGRVQWDRAEFDPTTTYAEFGKYDVRIKGTTYIIDSVLFYNEYFDKPLIGQLTEKVLADKTAEDASYPRFESYNKRLQIKNIFENVDYDGGFTMRGSKLAGTGTTEEPAMLRFYRDGKPFLDARSLEFVIRPDRFNSPHTSVEFKIEESIITHPDVSLKFDRTSRELVLIRSDEGLSKSPYINTYHNLDMFFEALYWNIDDPLIEMGSIFGSTQHYAAFESNTFFKEERYDNMIGFSNLHPLIEVSDYIKKNNKDSFYAYELGGYMRLSEEQSEVLLINMANTGFVDYDLNTKYCVVQQKLFNYIENASGKRDYDVLLFNSETDGRTKNAQLNLLNYNLLLKGIKRIQLSDSQNVTINPSNEEVIVKKNRDFKFGGRVWAGNFEFIGKDYFFNYEEFKIDLLAVDSCRIYVEDEEGPVGLDGKRPRSRVKNVLEDISGTLRIDSPTNKSGTQSKVYPQYPIFNCERNSYVYYDNSRIQKGAYKRDKFYYQILPFTIDSLDNFSKGDLKFNGSLVSAGIFPEITEPLVLMEDNALGFDLTTTGSGLPLYKGVGKFTTDIKLNYNGLQGNGAVDYLTANAESDQFIFLPDSTIGRTRRFENKEKRGGKEVPRVMGGATDLVFKPYQNFLTSTTTKDEPLTFFNDEAVLKGTLKLEPEGMTGNGDMEFSESVLGSEKFRYTARKILADTSNFELSNVDLGALAFKTDNVSADVDFDKRMGQFKSNGGETKIEFPANQYICFMDEFKWFMDKNEMELSSNRKPAEDFVIDTAEDQTLSNFFSVHETQDSLNFLAPNALYDVKTSTIRCRKVKFITVADSRVLPDSGMVYIRKRAAMDPLTRATVISNYVTQYHRVFDANIEIKGKKEYYGDGMYTYVDENKMEQIIKIDKIEVDSTLQTIGKGAIADDAAFMLSPFFEYQGKFELYANAQNLTFEGGTRIMQNCANIERGWFKFRSEINPKEIYIPVDTNMRDIGMAKLGAGVMVADDTPIDVYGSFLSRKKDRNDAPLIEAIGFLFYDKPTKTYKIGSKEKIKQPKLAGNLVTFNTENCMIKGDGEINYQLDFGHVKVKSFGDIENNTNTDSIAVSGTMSIDFFFDEGMLKRMTEQLEQWPGLQPVDITKTNYEKTIREVMSQEESDKVISELTLNGQFKRIPQELQKTLYLADVHFIWDDVEESFISQGPIGIASLDKKQVFKYVKGKIEMVKSRSADVLRVYIELDPGTWYFFEYKLGIMNITATDQDFINTLTELKDDKRKVKDEAGEKFVFQLVASKKKRNDFVDRFPDLN